MRDSPPNRPSGISHCADSRDQLTDRRTLASAINPFHLINRIYVYTLFLRQSALTLAKSERNVATRGISFELAAAFEWDTALIIEDTRQNYGEPRFQTLGLIEGRLHMLVFTPRET